MGAYRLNAPDAEAFWEDGYFVARHLFCDEEVELLREVTEMILPDDGDRLVRHDADGNQTLLSLRNDLRDDLFSAIIRSERMACTMSSLFGEEIYHYHHKVMVKEPLVGGAWEWHQDYGYWYHNGCLRPDMASCMLAITPSTLENGCLEVIKGSHLLGRIDHVDVDDQVCADPERVAEVLKSLPLEAVELAPGDAAFFHSNTLHRSQKNGSTEPRMSLIGCYNTKANDPFKEHHHASYSPLDILADAEVMVRGQEQLLNLRGPNHG
jgi:ectoine hydroxylase-related dioxygenase (phytanoyl-CoA dioxygenase family)